MLHLISFKISNPIRLKYSTVLQYAAKQFRLRSDYFSTNVTQKYEIKNILMFLF